MHRIDQAQHLISCDQLFGPRGESLTSQWIIKDKQINHDDQPED